MGLAKPGLAHIVIIIVIRMYFWRLYDSDDAGWKGTVGKTQTSTLATHSDSDNKKCHENVKTPLK